MIEAVALSSSYFRANCSSMMDKRLLISAISATAVLRRTESSVMATATSGFCGSIFLWLDYRIGRTAKAVEKRLLCRAFFISIEHLEPLGVRVVPNDRSAGRSECGDDLGPVRAVVVVRPLHRLCACGTYRADRAHSDYTSIT